MSQIIKARDVRSPHRGVQGAAFNFDDMTVKADEYLDGIRQQAAEILERARKEADQLRQKAEEEGRKAAQQAIDKLIEERLKKQLSTALATVDEATRAVRQARQLWIQGWERNAIQLATAIAERIIRRQIEQQPDIPLTLVREALELAAGGARLKLQMNPTDLEALGDHLHELIAEFDKLAPTDVVPNLTVRRGGCRVETEFGVIDHDIAAQLDRIEKELTG